MSELFSRSTSRRRAARGGFNEREPKPKGDGGLFGWTIFILLLVGLVAVCWMGTLYVFGHPELPAGYSILHKFKKLEAPKRFSEIAAPKGEFLDAKKLLARFNTMSPRLLKNESDRLLRAYIRNYQNPDGLVPYITGNYSILDSYQLTKDDFFQSGVVALAQDSEVPNVLIENVYTTDERLVPSLYRSLLTGLGIPIRRSQDLSPIIHIERLPDGRLKFTTVPIQYPNYSSPQGPGGFALEPPTTLNVEAGLPILSNAKVVEADRHYASFRHKLARPEAASAAPTNALMPVRPAVTSSGQAPAPTVARAMPANPKDIAPTPAPIAQEPAVAATPEPRVLPAIPVNVQPAQAVDAAPAVGTDVPLKPFIGSAPAAVASTTNGKWQTYKPGQMPRGKLVEASEASSLDDSSANERIYLKGNFVVTASGPTRAVMRSRGSDGAKSRVIVEFPTDQRAPAEGASVSREADRAFLITKVERKQDGTVNIWARVVTSE